MIIIGITGTLGAGKGTIVEYLMNNKSFEHFSVRNFLIEEIANRKLPVNRDSMTLVANELRAKHNPSYIIDRLFEIARKRGKNAIIESIRTPGEIESLRKKPGVEFILLSVDADPEIRYDRIKRRNSETDQISYTTFLSNEKREMDTSDPNKQNLKKCKLLADFQLMNNGDFKELYHQIEEILIKIGI